MTSILRRFAARQQRVEFCDACGTVCDAACRARRQRDQYRTTALQAFPGLR